MKFEELEKIKDISALKDNYNLEKQKEKANFEDIFEITIKMSIKHLTSDTALRLKNNNFQSCAVVTKAGPNTGYRLIIKKDFSTENNSDPLDLIYIMLFAKKYNIDIIDLTGGIIFENLPLYDYQW